MPKSLVLILALLIAPTSAHSEDYVVSGTVHLTDGNAIVCEDIRLTYRRDNVIGTTHDFSVQKVDDNRMVRLEDKDIRKISLFDFGKHWYDGTLMEVELANGKAATVRVVQDGAVKVLRPGLNVECRDEFTGKLQEHRLSWGTETDDRPKVLSVTFGESGNIKWSEGSKRYFPVGFQFDPYTGERLVLRDTTGGS